MFNQSAQIRERERRANEGGRNMEAQRRPMGDGLMGTLHGTLPARPGEHGVFRNIAHPRPHNNTNAMPFGPSAILAEPHEAPNANEGVSEGLCYNRRLSIRRPIRDLGREHDLLSRVRARLRSLLGRYA